MQIYSVFVLTQRYGLSAARLKGLVKVGLKISVRIGAEIIVPTSLVFCHEECGQVSEEFAFVGHQSIALHRSYLCSAP